MTGVLVGVKLGRSRGIRRRSGRDGGRRRDGGRLGDRRSDGRGGRERQLMIAHRTGNPRGRQTTGPGSAECRQSPPPP